MSSSPEEAWLQGRSAGAAGGSGAANPFAAGTDLALDWHDGWLEGIRRWSRDAPEPDAAGPAAEEAGGDGSRRDP